MTDTPHRIPWRPVAPLPPSEAFASGELAALDALRDEWERHFKALEEDDRRRVRQRSLRRLSIETGILERLYDVDWGLTLTLVAEGFTRDVVERVGGRVDDHTLATLRSQMESLGMVLDFVAANRALTGFFIRELHQAMTRTQNVYEVTDSLGRTVEHPLPRGVWKSQPNHVLRRDNTLLEYAPPAQVDSEIDNLVRYWLELDSTRAHPIVMAAWLHHRFVQIHPFADGNGRVARALTLLVLEKHHYAPLVVDRWHRADYLDALDAANDGTLAKLVRLFTRLESAALTSELERPVETPANGVALDVAHTLAAQLAEARRRQTEDAERQLRARAVAVGGRLAEWFGRKRAELRDVFRSQGLGDVAVVASTEMPPSPKATWWRRQAIESAQRAGHHPEFRLYSGWASLRIRTDRWQLRYVGSLHGAGRGAGVMAVTTFAEIAPYVPRDASGDPASPEYIPTTADAFRFVHSEQLDEVAKRASEMETLLDAGLAVALAELLKRS